MKNKKRDPGNGQLPPRAGRTSGGAFRSSYSNKTFWLAGALVWVLLTACGDKPLPTDESDKVLAKVYNRTLYLSDLEGMFPEGTTPADSNLIITAFANRWVREALLLNEAERNLPKDLNIDKLVRDYRASLIRNNYEQVLVNELLDSTITQSELQAFYEQNKEQYQLEKPIMRCRFLKLPIPIEQADSINLWWNNPTPDNLEKIRLAAQETSPSFILNDSTWYRVEEVSLALPQGTLTTDNVTYKRDFRQSDGEYQYYLKVFELKNRKEIAPLSYIEDQARKVILHSRKIKLLEKKREELFEYELRRNKVQLFID